MYLAIVFVAGCRSFLMYVWIGIGGCSLGFDDGARVKSFIDVLQNVEVAVSIG